MADIIIVAGMARSGKSKLADRLSQSGYSRIPGDAIISTMQALYPETGISHEGDYEVICRAFFPFLRRFVSALRHEGNSFVIDTARLLPADAASLVAGQGVRAVYLGYPALQPAEKLAYIRNYPNASDWTRDVPDPLLAEMAKNLIALSRKTAEQCKALDLPFYDTGRNFEGALAEAQRLLTTPQ